MLVHTVLKLMLLAITATYASSGASSGSGTSLDVEALARVLVGRRHALEHRGLVATDDARAVALREGQRGDLGARCIRLDRVEDVLHGGTLPSG